MFHKYDSMNCGFSELPVGEKLHDLCALLNFDVTKLSGEVLGAESVRRHQEILQEHWSSADVGMLPGDDVQRCLLGVCTVHDLVYFYYVLQHIMYSAIENFL